LDPKPLALQLHAHLGAKKTTAKLRIKVLDMDDNAPEVQMLNSKQMPLELPENAKTGQKLVDLLILDRDHVGKNQRFKYKLSGEGAENFQLKLVSFEFVEVQKCLL
jgi:hypothetical protein